MGWVIFLAIVAAIVALIVLGVKRKKRKRAEAEAASIEELKNSNAYSCAKSLKNLFGYEFNKDTNGEAWFGCSDCHGVPQAWGTFSCELPGYNDKRENAYLSIFFSEYKYQITRSRDSLLCINDYSYKAAHDFDRKYAISSNLGVFIQTDEATDDVPECLKFAAALIQKVGGDCELLESPGVNFRRRLAQG